MTNKDELSSEMVMNMPAKAMSLAPRICVFGCALQTENLGVDALGTSILKGIHMAFPEARITMQDWSGCTQGSVQTQAGEIDYECLPVFRAESLRRRNGTAHLEAVAPWFGRMPRALARLLAGYNPTLKKLLQTDVVLDISAGDSFADIYGIGGFHGQALYKEVVLALGVPLILMPQTYGPFENATSIQRARHILSRSTMIASREEHGLEDIEHLCGSDHPPVVRCPDVAFLLDPMPIPENDEPFLKRRDEHERLIGLNISGLLCSDQKDFGFRVSYVELIRRIVHWAMRQSNTRLLLVPHVIDKGVARRSDGKSEMHDTASCRNFYQEFSSKYGNRIGCLGGPYLASQTKYAVGCCDFFIGARMHSCIAGVSQAVPTVTLAYSKKALGLMKQLGVPETVVDMRSLDEAECVEQIDANYQNRQAINDHLSQRLPQFIGEVERFFTQDIAGVVRRVVGASG
ncbi:hypothetical protein HED60_22255 [Planctomycetales bacterium ZRK34]|nr:hypothetical protein HED60_22255 [Planctomycetales bacterium ZRK34]